MNVMTYASKLQFFFVRVSRILRNQSHNWHYVEKVNQPRLRFRSRIYISALLSLLKYPFIFLIYICHHINNSNTPLIQLFIVKIKVGSEWDSPYVLQTLIKYFLVIYYGILLMFYIYYILPFVITYYYVFYSKELFHGIDIYSLISIRMNFPQNTVPTALCRIDFVKEKNQLDAIIQSVNQPIIILKIVWILKYLSKLTKGSVQCVFTI